MPNYSVAKREEAMDWMADYPGFGEMRWYSEVLGTEQVSFSWRAMPPGTGGRGSYGHRHPGQEEVYFVIAGQVTFKIDDDVFEVGPRTAVRIGGDAFRSVLLLLVRLYWGWQFFVSGRGHLRSLDGTADFFASLHLPAPRFQAHATATSDRDGRLWVAWDESGPQWGKDTGFLYPNSPATRPMWSRPAASLSGQR